jgi:hypothetical protein
MSVRLKRPCELRSPGSNKRWEKTKHGRLVSGLAASIRPYAKFADIWHMVSRTAFTQLRYSATLLAATLLGLTIVWLVLIAAWMQTSYSIWR